MRIFSRNVMGWQNLEKNNPKSKYKVSKISQPNFYSLHTRFNERVMSTAGQKFDAF